MVGDYKEVVNEAGGIKTTDLKNAQRDMSKLMEWYNSNAQDQYTKMIEYYLK